MLPRPPTSTLFPYTTLFRSATVGKSRAVVEIGRARFGGLLAWLAWMALHITVLIGFRSEEHTSELQSRRDLVCRLLLEKKKTSRSWLYLSAFYFRAVRYCSC